MHNPNEPMDRSITDEPLAGEDAGFDMGIVHLYRGEMQRMTVWRQRLDITSNWAILLTVALTTFTLGHVDVPHYTLLLGLALIGVSVLIEGRRYCHLHHSGWRLYLMEVGYFARRLHPTGQPHPSQWRELLARDLRRPRLLVSWFTGARVRLRRNYLLILCFVTAAWFTKLFIHPAGPSSVGDFYARLAVGELLPPWLVAVTAITFIGSATALALTCPQAETIEKWGGSFIREHAPDAATDQGPPARVDGTSAGNDTT